MSQSHSVLPIHGGEKQRSVKDLSGTRSDFSSISPHRYKDDSQIKAMELLERDIYRHSHVIKSDVISTDHYRQRETSLKRNFSETLPNYSFSGIRSHNLSSPFTPQRPSHTNSTLTNMGNLNQSEKNKFVLSKPENYHNASSVEISSLQEIPSQIDSRLETEPGRTKPQSRVTFAHDGHAPTCRNQKNKLTKKRKNEHRFVASAMFLCYVIILLCFLLFLSLSFLIYFMLSIEEEAKNNATFHRREFDSNKLHFNKTNLIKNARSDCVKPKYLESLSRALSNLDLSTDPCQDFYQFACGGWKASHSYPPTKRMYGVNENMEELNERRFIGLLDRDDRRGLTQAEIKVIDFYKSCVDQLEIERRGVQPLLALLNWLGGWYAIGTWNATRWDLNGIIYQCQANLSLSVFFSINVSPSLTYRDRNAVFITPRAFLTFGKERFYFGKRAVELEEILKRAIHDLLRLVTSQNLSDIINDVYEMEKKLSEAFLVNARRRFLAPWKEITIGQLSHLCPQINWLEILQRIFRSTPIESTTRIWIQQPIAYFRNLSLIIKNSTARALNNYVMWSIVFSRSDLLSSPFRHILTSLERQAFGSKSARPRWSECLGYAKEQFPDALEKLFVRAYFEPTWTTKIEGIAKNIKVAYQEYVAGRDWLDPTTRQKLIKKLKTTKFRIGNSALYFDDHSSLNKLYKFPVKANKYFENFQRSVESRAERATSKLGTRPGSLERLLRFDFSGTYYEQLEGEVVLPIPYLQPPLYDVNSPEAFNYASLGSAIAHELTHAIDHIADLNLTSSEQKTLRKKLDCVVRKYNIYSPLAKMGSYTYKENIPDMTGVKVAFFAYRKSATSWTTSIHPDFNNDQLFFINYAQSWCVKRKDQVWIVGHHAAEKYRVIAPLSELQQFSVSFHCKKGTAMNPIDGKCSLW